MTRIDFYYDPSCPFCWITSRWLLRVSQDRDLEVTWRPFSLAIKNSELDGDESAKTPHGAGHRQAHRVLRVISAAAAQGASTIDLYSDFGRRHHVEGGDFDDAMIAAVLADHDLAPELARAADDTRLDEGLHAELDSALEAAGDDVGVPIIVFTGEDGTRRGYFGPVLNALPSQEEGLRIWDGLERMAPVTAFYELKRSRPGGGPDLSGTGDI